MNWKNKLGAVLDWALSLLGFFPQVAMLDRYGDKLRAFVVVVAEFLEEAIEDNTETKLGKVRLAAFDQLLEQMIQADKDLKAEPDKVGLKGLAHWILETYIAGQKAKGLWK
jgi:hypothetical protein